MSQSMQSTVRAWLFESYETRGKLIVRTNHFNTKEGYKRLVALTRESIAATSALEKLNKKLSGGV